MYCQYQNMVQLQWLAAFIFLCPHTSIDWGNIVLLLIVYLSKNYAEKEIFHFNYLSYKAHIWYEIMSHWHTFAGAKVMVICQGQGHVYHNFFVWGISTSKTHFVILVFSVYRDLWQRLAATSCWVSYTWWWTQWHMWRQKASSRFSAVWQSLPRSNYSSTRWNTLCFWSNSAILYLT